MEDVRVGERLETVTYFEDALGRPPGRSEDPLTDGVKAGTTLVGSPETVARGIQNLVEHSEGGFGGFLFRAHDWADREQTWRSYELFARWVMPRFQESLDMPQELLGVVRGEPQDDLRAERRGAAPGVHRCWPGGAGPV